MADSWTSSSVDAYLDCVVAGDACDEESIEEGCSTELAAVEQCGV